MAKKSQAVQLQQEINTDDDWDKMLHKDGLIVVDIYSEWCGPCSAMNANLKKLKLEIGGDNLHLAMAKSDNITCLERFRNKSEPTWMFIANGKMVNLMFGANAPKLVRLIIQELNNEAEVKEGKRERKESKINELAAEEQVRYDAAKKIRDDISALETEKREQVLRAKRLSAANVVLDNIPQCGVILVFPHVSKQAQSTLGEFWNSFGLALSVIEKPHFTETTIEELLYFANTEFNKIDKYNLLNAQNFIYLIKPTGQDEFNGDIDMAVLELVYGSSKCSPGSPESPAQLLITHATEKEIKAKLAANSKSVFQSKALASKMIVTEDEESNEHEEEILELSGLWAPPNALTRATAIKLCFPKLYDPIAIPEPPPVPPHVAVAYEVFKTKDVLDLINEHRNDVIRYGFFSDDNPETAKLIAKTLPMFEKIYANGTTYTERLVIQLSKQQMEPLSYFLKLGPTFVSVNSLEGEQHCKLFFPKDYDVPNEEQGAVEVKKKKKRGKKPKETAIQQEALVEGEHEVADETGILEEETEGEQGEGESEGEAEGEIAIVEDNVDVIDEQTIAEGADKSTSPMPEEPAN